MKDHGKKLSFSISLYEYSETIPTLYSTFQQYARNHPGEIYHETEPDSLWSFITDSSTDSYNNCHFWSSFQVNMNNNINIQKANCLYILIMFFTHFYYYTIFYFRLLI